MMPPDEQALLSDAKRRYATVLAGQLATDEQKIAAAEPQIGPDLRTPEETLATGGRMGRFMEPVRTPVRDFVEGQPFLDQLILEMSPAVVGTAAGAALGTPLGPPGMIAGGALGGAAGEFLGQATGVSPPSDLGLAAAGAGPLAGVGTAKAVQTVGRTVGGAALKIPAAMAARANNAERKFVEEFGNIAGALLGKQRGLKAIPAKDLFETVRRAGVNVPTTRFTRTITELKNLRGQIEPLMEFPEAAAASRIIDQALGSSMSPEIPLDTIVGIRQQLGRLVGRLEKSGGIRSGASKAAFKAISNDLDDLAKGGGKGSRGAQVAKAANDRFKIEMAGKEFEQAIAKFSSPVPGEDAVAVNVKNLRKWLFTVTNPKSKNYDKNFTAGFKDVFAEVSDRLRELSKITAVSRSAAGPGSIVVRGITAGAGGVIGHAVAGPAGAGVGALYGATGPDALMKALMTKRGAKMLESAARLGRGTISYKTWENIGQVVTQASFKGEDD